MTGPLIAGAAGVEQGPGGIAMGAEAGGGVVIYGRHGSGLTPLLQLSGEQVAWLAEQLSPATVAPASPRMLRGNWRRSCRGLP